MAEILLGSRVKDRVTGFEGIATGRCEYLSGCVQILIKPEQGKDKTMPEGHWIDIDVVDVVGKGLLKKLPEKKKTGARTTGGPMADCPEG